MDEKLLFDNEHIITQSNGKVITLTNYRLRYTESNWGKAYIISMLLEKISSIEVHYRSSIIFVLLALISAGAGIIASLNGDEELFLPGLGGGLILFLIYLGSRKHYMTISSDNGKKINFRTKGMKREMLMDFVNEVESAIMKRREELK